MEAIFQTSVMVTGCGCGSRFCEPCAMAASRKIRAWLPLVLAKWDGVLMLTLTLDPSLFDGPEAAHTHVTSKGAISRVMKECRRLGFIGQHYFWVLEFMENGYPHWHILVESKHLPLSELQRLWGLFRPKSAPAYVPEYRESDGKLVRPALGWCKISGGTFESPEHAAHYACKYLVKEPVHGYPDWLLQSRRNVHKHGVSKGFWSAFKGQDSSTVTKAPVGDLIESEKPFRDRQTLEVRMLGCCTECIIREVTTSVDEEGELRQQNRVWGRITLAKHRVEDLAGHASSIPGNSFDVPRDFASDMLRMYKKRKGFIHGNPRWFGPPAPHVGYENNPYVAETGLPRLEYEQASLILDNGELVAHGTNYL